MTQEIRQPTDEDYKLAVNDMKEMATQEINRRLTEYLGECWHENPGKPINSQTPDVFTCVKCGEYFNRLNKSRTFATWPDLGALTERLAEKGDWSAFNNWAFEIWRDTPGDYEWELWLLNPTRFCELVGEWIEKGK